jgi:hypothetical protein
MSQTPDLRGPNARPGHTTWTLGPDAGRPDRPSETAPLPGLIGRFEIRRFLGEGGFGRVYEAFDPSLKRPIALKVARPEQLLRDNAVERFLREARAVAHLMHPHIVTVFDSGQDGPHHYIASALVPGQSLSSILSALPPGKLFPTREAVTIVRKLAEALAYAHRNGIIHRDVKPGNVLLDLNGEPYLTDFGLAARQDDPQKLTKDGMIMGTPEYTAPEQWRGQAEAASDQYSLGCMLYELLTGQAPFSGFSTEHYLLLHTHHVATAPRRVNPDLPRDLETITLKCLNKDPASRYRDCQALADDLRRWLEGEPVQARPPGPAERLVKWARRSPALATALCALAVLTLVAGTIITWQWQTAVAALSRAEHEQRQRALAQVQALRDAAPAAVPSILAELQANAREILPRLRELHEQEQEQAKRMRLALALVEDEVVRSELANGLITVEDPAEVQLVRDALQPYGDEFVDRLWKKSADEKAPPGERFRALVGLAGFDARSSRWEKSAREVIGDLVGANPLHLGLWVQMFRPVRAALVEPLGEVFRGKRFPEQRQVAATILADYAADRPDVLAELLLDADPQQYARLRPILERHRQQAEQRMRRALLELPDYWNDRPLDPSWQPIATEVKREIEQAGGLVAERFALCQSLPLARLLPLTDCLRGTGYRPLRVRPWRDEKGIRVGMVWTRDGRDWRLEAGCPRGDVRQREALRHQAGFVLADVAGYLVDKEDYYALLWAESRKGEQVVLDLAIAENDLAAHRQQRVKEGLQARTQQGLRGADGSLRYTILWAEEGDRGRGTLVQGEIQREYRDRVYAMRQMLTDVDVTVAAISSTREFLDARLAENTKRVTDNPNAKHHLFHRGLAWYHLGDDKKALEDMEAFMADGKAVYAYRYRALIHARAGRQAEARRDMETFARKANDRNDILTGWALLDVHLGRPNEGLSAIERAIKVQPRDSRLLYRAAKAYAQAAAFASTRQTAQQAGLVGNPSLGGLALRVVPTGEPERYAQRSLALLRRAVSIGRIDMNVVWIEIEFAPLRGLPGFHQLFADRAGLWRYASVWQENVDRQVEGLFGLTPDQHLARCRTLAAEGYRPVALSLASASGSKHTVAASVWHRPTLSINDEERAGRRQATAGATLLHLGQSEPVWPLWRNAPNPTARAYLIQRAGMLGVDPRILIDRLDKEKDGSSRRALILALGDYTEAELPARWRAPLVQKLLTWYRDDPDPGIHSAIDWLLRQDKDGRMDRALAWGQKKELDRINQTLARRDPDGKRRWYVNHQGQTMVTIKGPVEFRMGIPYIDPNQNVQIDRAHRRRIVRNFAIASTPVTVAQWQQFLQDRPEVKHTYSKPISPDADGPIIAVTWFEAAKYCNWLSEKEGIPREQWCYPDEVREGTEPFPDHLQRKGYRLATEGEWEYACRAGTTSLYHFGSAVELLPRYAWYLANSDSRVWPVGQKRPNDLGLFDLHGNVWTWCQEADQVYNHWQVVDREDLRVISDRNLRSIRGAAFTSLPQGARSATRLFNRPSGRHIPTGLRIARTID